MDRLSNLVALFAKPELDFRGKRAEGDDLPGDTYEYLMARVIDLGSIPSGAQAIYDPACGSGSLLLTAHDEAHACTCLSLASPHFTTPAGALKTFDHAVAIPPFSTKAWTNGFDPAHDEFHRFTLGGQLFLPPAKNGDSTFLVHELLHLLERHHNDHFVALMTRHLPTGSTCDRVRHCPAR